MCQIGLAYCNTIIRGRKDKDFGVARWRTWKKKVFRSSHTLPNQMRGILILETKHWEWISIMIAPDTEKDLVWVSNSTEKTDFTNMVMKHKALLT